MTTKKAIVQHVKGVTFIGKADTNHWIVMDGPEEFGGSNAGTRPKELLLIALGGCTASDVASILKKKRVNLKNFYLNIDAEVSPEPPQVYTKINIEYVVEGKNIEPKDVERAIELSSTKYCAVSHMLKNSVNITHAYKIIEIE